MKNFLLLLLTGLTFILTTSASASPYAAPYLSYLDLDSQDVIFNAGGNESKSHTWNFDLINDTLSEGDVDGNDVISSAFLCWTISEDLKDNNPNFYEYIDIYINDNLLFGDWEMDNGSWVIDTNLLDLVTTPSIFKVEFKDFNDGHKNKDWDIMVSDVKIFGVYTDMHGNHAPEPSTLMLFGFGLLALAGISRKKSTHKVS
ncbi:MULTISPECIES: PEP-CTERM sorting domain-containing protein [Desulfobacula]|uniref:Uncharacterized protein associated with molybdenum ABC transporter n=2 Tax=Desulfobacula TaxID=28222 RepID=K0NEW4_DESTT|nr:MULTISPECIES: PEP-CTERM sorting domain-containing protein [Desulfobacula]CCK79480.1 uncharacterized protein associated with molybdenum ABC transporter [Desulfobacula toluolica Tol2]SDT84428.1 PEP-CTERM protein-sorting domain-containing protein [Desulfobacula phenolica]